LNQNTVFVAYVQRDSTTGVGGIGNLQGLMMAALLGLLKKPLNQ
jgi:hypothetical protein